MSFKDRNLRVISDGTPTGTKVYAGDTEITNQVTDIDISIHARNKIATARIVMYVGDVDITVDKDGVAWQ